MKSKILIICLKIVFTIIFAFIGIVSLLEILYSKHIDGFIPYVSISSFILFFLLLFNLIRKNYK